VKGLAALVVGCAGLVVFGCSGSQTKTTDPAPAQDAGSLGDYGTVAGTFPLVPGQPSFVLLNPLTPHAFPLPDSMPVMDQKGLMFLPPVLFVRTGQAVDFQSHDEHMHNINVEDADSRKQMFNVVIPTEAHYQFTFDHDGFYDVTCDIHSYMRATIVATSSPYATASTDGHFQFDAVEPGPYTLTVYSGAGKDEVVVDITAGERATVRLPVQAS
jgi:hypothetical protein